MSLESLGCWSQHGNHRIVIQPPIGKWDWALKSCIGLEQWARLISVQTQGAKSFTKSLLFIVNKRVIFPLTQRRLDMFVCTHAGGGKVQRKQHQCCPNERRHSKRSIVLPAVLKPAVRDCSSRIMPWQQADCFVNTPPCWGWGYSNLTLPHFSYRYQPLSPFPFPSCLRLGWTCSGSLAGKPHLGHW